MARGIEGRAIFGDDEDRVRFLSFLEEYLSKSGCACYAWTLMSNHYHLLIQTGNRPLSELMRPLNSRYAQYYARKHNRRGYLFQDRYKSIATQDQFYIRVITRYIHGNPLRAGICKNLAELAHYRWSSHTVLLGRRECEFMDSWVVLRRFGQNKVGARREYLEYMAAGIEQADYDLIRTIRMSNDGREHTHNPGCWVIGDPELVKQALAADKTHRIKLARYRAEGVTIEALGRKYSHLAGISELALRQRTWGTAASELRKVFAYLCRKEYGFPVVEIGRYLGMQGPPASICIHRGQELARERRYANILASLRP